MSNGRRDVLARELAEIIRAHLVDASMVPGGMEGSASLEPNLGMRRMADRGDARRRVARSKPQRGGFVGRLVLCGFVIAFLLFIFGPVLGLRETGSQIRSRKIHEEHERRIQDTLEYSERERRRTEEDLKRYRKEIFGDQ